MALVRQDLRLRLFWLGSGGLLMVAVFALSLLPMPALMELPGSGYDKVLHGAAFTVLMIWFAGIVAPRYFWLLAVCLLTYGGAIEVAQSFVPTRFMEWGDLIADAAGVALGWVLSLIGLRHWCRWLERLSGVA